MEQKEFIITFTGLSMKQVRQVFLLEGESATLKLISIQYLH